MNATPLEWTRLLIATLGLIYITRGAWQMRRDYRLLHSQIAWLNAANGVLRVVGIAGMWSVALVAVIYDRFPSAWVTYSQITYTLVIACMVGIGRNIRKAQRS